MKTTLIRYLTVVLVIVLCFAAVACNSQIDTEGTKAKKEETTTIKSDDVSSKETEETKDAVSEKGDGSASVEPELTENDASDEKESVDADDTVSGSAAENVTETVDSEGADSNTNTDTEGESVSDGSETGGQVVTGEEAESYFEEIRQAIENAKKYDGAYTFFVIQQMASVDPIRGEYNSKLDQIYSVDPENGRYITAESITSNNNSYGDTEKGFLADGVYYLYTLSKYGEDESACYTKYSAENGLPEYVQSVVLSELIPSFVGGSFLAESFSELTDTFASVYATLQANEIAKMIEAGKLADSATLTLTPDVKIVIDEDGTVIFKINSVTYISEYTSKYDEIIKNCVIDVTRSISLKDGMIVAADIELSAHYDAKGGEGNDEIVTVGNDLSLNYDFEYKFNEEAYNSVNVSTPEDLAEVEEIRSEGVNVYIDGLEHFCFVDGSMTSAELLEDMAQSVSRDFGSYYDPETNIELPCITVKDFYADAELTEKLDPEKITVSEILALGDIYADYELLDGFAIVVESSTEKIEISREYQIVYNELFGAVMESNKGNVHDVSLPYFLNYNSEGELECKVYLNGVEIDVDSGTGVIDGEFVMLEGGVAYHIDYVTVISDKDLGIDFINSMVTLP